jgi:hypothetical protein
LTAATASSVRRAFAAASLALAAFALAPAAPAATYRVDDAATIVENTVVKMRWRNVAPSRRTDNAVLGTTRVNVRLNLAPWQQRNARLYLVLPVQPPAPLVARWSTQGRLQPGEVVSGQRTLVYAGPVTTAVLDETLVLQLETDGEQLEALHRIDFHFEIDVE